MVCRGGECGSGDSDSDLVGGTLRAARSVRIETIEGVSEDAGGESLPLLSRGSGQLPGSVGIGGGKCRGPPGFVGRSS